METIDISKKSKIELKTNYRDRSRIENTVCIEFDEELELCMNVRQADALADILRRYHEAFYGVNALASTRTVDSD